MKHRNKKLSKAAKDLVSKKTSKKQKSKAAKILKKHQDDEH